MARRRGSQLHTSEVVMTGIARGVLFMSLLFSGCATRTPPTIEPHAPPRPPVPAMSSTSVVSGATKILMRRELGRVAWIRH